LDWKPTADSIFRGQLAKLLMDMWLWGGKWKPVSDQFYNFYSLTIWKAKKNIFLCCFSLHCCSTKSQTGLITRHCWRHCLPQFRVQGVSEQQFCGPSQWHSQSHPIAMEPPTQVAFGCNKVSAAKITGKNVYHWSREICSVFHRLPWKKPKHVNGFKYYRFIWLMN